MAERSPRDPRDPLDEEAAWAEIVAGYGEQPEFPTADERPARTGPDKGDAGDEAGDDAMDEGPAGTDTKTGKGAAGARPGSFIVFAPGVGPRDWSAAEASDDDFDATDEGHFTPPEPPPLPQADVTTKFAWIAVLGGPLLLVAMVIIQQPVTWWIAVLGIGGFLGGFATLVGRMKNDGGDDDDLPGGGAVV
ncbi:hypothetical protein [Streptomyces natalensis]|uniref:Membrane protein n=1 Tax=Streptomyces natalensis ATCC 27448 TaxID=1240678 RepID=A0A0D7CQ87_9ACTN|nr:hypothetical protein [Streptomyces natalensis]KIZ18201.1 membrane protein [Streptomyces natalensis ATCC 27448]